MSREEPESGVQIPLNSIYGRFRASRQIDYMYFCGCCIRDGVEPRDTFTGSLLELQDAVLSLIDAVLIEIVLPLFKKLRLL